jgi:aquaporin related protein
MNIDQPSENIVLPGMSAKKINLDNDHSLEKHRRSALLSKLPASARGHIVAFIGEFVGTFMFLFFAFSGTQVANTTTAGSQTSTAASVSTAPNTSNLLYVALAFGFSLTVNAWVFFRVTGGLFNPAVSLQDHKDIVFIR